MDEQLRANPDDLVALMRAGRLSRERVAMASYLGDERALATGVKPWRPPRARPEWVSPARFLMHHAALTHRQRVWLACLCCEHVLDTEESKLAAEAALSVTRRWCLGKADWHEVYRAHNPLDADSSVAFRLAPTVIDAGLGPDSERLASPGSCAGAVKSAEGSRPIEEREAEQAWQAQAIAAVLLDPTWPPWDE